MQIVYHHPSRREAPLQVAQKRRRVEWRRRHILPIKDVDVDVVIARRLALVVELRGARAQPLERICGRHLEPRLERLEPKSLARRSDDSRIQFDSRQLRMRE